MEITFGGHTIAFGPEMSPRQKTSVLDAVTKTYQTTAIEVEHESRKLLAEKIEEMKELYWLMIGKTADEKDPWRLPPPNGVFRISGKDLPVWEIPDSDWRMTIQPTFRLLNEGTLGLPQSLEEAERVVTEMRRMVMPV